MNFISKSDSVDDCFFLFPLFDRMLFQYTINYIFCFLRQSHFPTADHLPKHYLLDVFT